MSNILNDLTSAPEKRTRTHNATTAVKLPQSALDLIKTAAQAQEISVSAVIRTAVAEYLQRRGYLR